MGFYLEPPVPPNRKSDWLKMNCYGERETPPEWYMIPKDCTVICCVDNGPFEAAAVCFSKRELAEFSQPDDPRPKHWYLMEKADMLKLHPEFEDIFEDEDEKTYNTVEEMIREELEKQIGTALKTYPDEEQKETDGKCADGLTSTES